MTKVAVVNSAENKEELLADAAIKAAYDHAYEVLTDLTRSESEINQACEVLTAALPQSEEHTLTYDSNGAQGKITDDTCTAAATWRCSSPAAPQLPGGQIFLQLEHKGGRHRQSLSGGRFPPVSGRRRYAVRHLGTTSMPSPMT